MDRELIVKISNTILSHLENYKDINLVLLVKNISNIIIDKFNLKDYVKDIEILEVYDKNNHTRGLQDKENNIYIFKEPIEKNLEKVLSEVPILSTYEINLYRYLLYIKTVIHELEHTKQKKILKDNCENDSLESLIIKLCNTNNINKNVYYYCLYETHPTERLAEIKALRTITKITEYIEVKSNTELLSYCIQKQSLLEEFYNYYNYGLIESEYGPTEIFFKHIDNNALSILKNKINKKNLNLEERLLFGLKISEKEYEDTVLKYRDYDEKIKELSKVHKK